MKKLLKIIALLIVVGLLLMFGWLISGQLEPTTEAMAKYETLDTIQKDNYIQLSDGYDTGLIFYTGALVDPVAYSYLGDVKANVYIIESPFNMAFFSRNMTNKIIEENSGIENWYIAGHSLGGVIAYDDGIEYNDVIDGIILLASYPLDDRSSFDENVLALYGLNDGLVDDYKIQEEKLPTSSEIVEIEGANHAGFGDYGEQKGDNESTISVEEQNEIIVKEINKFIK